MVVWVGERWGRGWAATRACAQPPPPTQTPTQITHTPPPHTHTCAPPPPQVRVLNCQGDGSVSDVIQALAWLKANAERPAVATMSLGGDIQPALDLAVRALATSGVSVVVAAGNGDTNACNTSPAREPSAVTVGATDERCGRRGSGSRRRALGGAGRGGGGSRAGRGRRVVAVCWSRAAQSS